MRKILFRGKTESGDWAYGYYAFAPKRTGMFGQTIRQADFDRHYILTMKYNLTKEVFPETVGQYTGLTDKNGNKIFEGDIMPVWENGEEYHYKVIYNGDCFMLSMLDSEQGSYPLSVKNSISEVIGNIHDNKLEGF